MVGICDEFFLGACRCAPQQEYNGSWVVVKLLYDGVCKACPADFAVAVCLPAAHSQCGVEHQNTLLCPCGQAAVLWLLNPHIGFQLFEYIAKAGRRGDAGLHGKAKSMCLLGTVIGVLPE